MKKKIIFDFVIALIALILAVGMGGYVLHLAIQRKGDIFYRYTSSESSDSGKSSKKKSNSGSSYKEADENTGTLWIGDSRFVGMDKAVNITENEHNYLVAKIGQGLPWFRNTALTRVKKIRSQNTALKKWRYVICLGVNDLGDIDSYIQEYKDLTASDDSIELILVSVNPVKNYPSISNDDIESFNDKLESACDENGWYYIDTYSSLISDGYTTTDGLHYDNDTYETIYQLIRQGLSDYEKGKATASDN